MGEEEQTILGPVVLKAQAMGLDVSGPFSPDTVYMRARHMQVSKRAGEVLSSEPEPFDVVIAMYHDQGLIPVKYMGLDEGVNITLGLPIVRTSPDHGTAFDIAGTGRCDERSFLEAFRQAQKMAGA
jgi:4-hydroxythreonine-4-phosphate dehydrogenase